jgi:Family of unknown function (DUF5302)
MRRCKPYFLEPQEVRMAVEQSGAEASSGPTKPAGADRRADDAPSGSAAGEHDTAKADIEDVKRKYREALERKRGAHASGNAEGAKDTGKVHGSHGPAATRRSFRRKSGG